jgi:hypothetical protein
MRADVLRPGKENSCFGSLFLQLARVDGLSNEGPYENSDNAPGKREE